jgi:hypothetical protein
LALVLVPVVAPASMIGNPDNVGFRRNFPFFEPLLLPSLP